MILFSKKQKYICSDSDTKLLKWRKKSGQIKNINLLGIKFGI